MRPDIIYIQQIEMKWYALVIGIRIYNSKDPIPFEHSKNGSHTDNLASTDLKNAYTKKKKMLIKLTNSIRNIAKIFTHILIMLF